MPDEAASGTLDNSQPSDPRQTAREQLELLAEASLILGASLDYATTLKSLGEFLVPHLADVCVIDLVTAKGEFKRVSITAHAPERQTAMEALARHFPPDPKSGASRRVVETRQPLVIPQVDAESQARVADSDFHRSLLKASGVTSVLIVPLLVRERVIGAISFGMADSARTYSNDDLPLAMAIARRAALAVDNARLYRKTQRANRRRKRAVKQMQSMSDALPMLISYVDRDGIYRFANKSYDHWLNLPASSMVGRNIKDLLGSDGYEHVKHHMEAALGGQSVRFMTTFPYPDGLVRSVDVRYIPDLGDEGEVRGFFAVVNDITALIQAEEQARLYADVAANVPVGLVIWRLDDPTDAGSLRLLAANPAAIHLSLVDLRTLGKTIREISPTSVDSGRAVLFADAARKQQVIDLGETHIPKTDTHDERFFSVLAFPLPDSAIGVIFDDTTERRRIQDQAALYGDVAKHASIGLTLWKLDQLDDPESLRLIAANPAMEAILQQSMESHIGKRIYDVFPEMEADSRAAMYADVVRTGQAIELNQYATDHQSAQRLYAIRAFPLPGQRVGVALHDVTDLRRAQQQLSSTLERTRALYAISRQISMAHTPQQILEVLLTSTNLGLAERAAVLTFDQVWDAGLPEYAEVIAHWSRDPQPMTIIGQRLLFSEYQTERVFDPSNVVIVQNIHTDARVSEATRAAMSAVGASSFIMFPLVASAHTFGMVTLQASAPFDLTDQDVAYLKGLIDQAASALYTLMLLARETAGRQAAEQSVQDRMRFLAMVSHELRTPLSSIKGFASSLLAEDVTWDAESQYSFLQVINEEADRLAELVEQVLDLSRLEAGTLSIQLKPVTIQQIVSTTLPQLVTICADHQLDLALDQNLPAVMADSRRIEQVLTNLTHNACKYSPSGSRITIAAAVEGANLRVSVTDQGVGIPPSEHATVFETFRQASNRPPTETRGVGLGLTITRALIEAHNGSIWIADSSDQGTTIAFTLPIA